MITAYLTFKGNTEEAFNFYKSVLGGDFTSLERFGGTPQGETMSDEDKDKIMHITLRTSNDSELMGNDHLEFMGLHTMGNNISLSLHPQSEAEADKWFKGLSEGGKVNMPLEKVFWGAYFGMLTDKFGIHWMVNFQYK